MRSQSDSRRASRSVTRRRSVPVLLAVLALAGGCVGPAGDEAGEHTGSTSQGLTAVHTAFDPTVDMLGFTNDFKDYSELPAGLDFRSGGLCGGMTYSVLDYWYSKVPIPNQDYRPAEGTSLQSYIYARQFMSLFSNVDKWAEVMFNPGGIRNQEFFQWGLQGGNGGRIEELRSYLDAGKPVPLGMKGTNGTGDHQVLAIGYDMGRYQGDLGQYQGDFRIFIADPNYPGTVRTLMPNLVTQRFTYVEDPNHTGIDEWVTYFVDANYQAATPPNVTLPTYPDDGLIHELLVRAWTGSDDMRGGNDNVNLTVNMTDGTSMFVGAINNGARWISNYEQIARMVLPRAVRQGLISSITLSDTFGGGIGGDNWDMSALLVEAVGHQPRWQIARQGFHRFQADSSRNLTFGLDPLPPLPSPIANTLIPAAGYPEGGTSVRILGDNFDVNGRTRVFFGGREATNVSCASPTVCAATSPPGLGAVEVNVLVNDVSTPMSPTMQYYYAPSIDGLASHVGTIGDVATIYGIGLQSGATTILFGSVPATNATCDGATCSVTVPPGAGLVDVRAVVNGHTSPVGLGDQFQYGGPMITGISASHGPISGDTYVLIKGSGFDTSVNAAQVRFGGVLVPSECYASNSCQARSPAGVQLGAVDVTVSSFGQTSPSTCADVFTYYPNAEVEALTYAATGYLRLNGDAPAGGAAVLLTSSDPSLMAPTTLTVPAGRIDIPSFELPMTSTTETFTLTASYLGSTTSATLNGYSAPPPFVLSTHRTLPFTAGATQTETITLHTAAPSGGAVIALSASDATLLTVAPSVTVPAGTTTLTFPVTSDYSGIPKVVTVSATYAGLTATGLVSVGHAITL